MSFPVVKSACTAKRRIADGAHLSELLDAFRTGDGTKLDPMMPSVGCCRNS